jgi:uncharacterized membrane protein
VNTLVVLCLVPIILILTWKKDWYYDGYTDKRHLVSGEKIFCQVDETRTVFLPPI